MYAKVSQILNRPDFGLLIFRVVVGGSMATHGYSKFLSFGERGPSFIDPFGIGGPATLALVVFAELVCAIAVALGIFTRLASIPPLIAMLFAFFVAHANDPFQKGELAFVYAGCFFLLMLTGSGKFAVKAD